MSIFKNKLQICITLVFIGFIIWWLSFQHVVSSQGASVNWFENTYGLVALIGSIIGLCAMKKWGGLKTVLGKSLLFFSLGLFAQEAGQLISSYYTQVAKVDLPYPSVGDVAYFGSVLLYICAVVYLSKMAGVKFAFKQPVYKFIALAVPVILLAISYTVLLHHHQYDTTKPLTVFLDAGYPIGQACYISIAIVAYLLSRKIMGGIMRAGFVLVILALFIQYISDFTFIYQSHRSTYVPGKFDDLFYLTAYFVMATAMIKFLNIYKGLSNKAIAPKADKA
jgi:hypothetical protein